MQKFVLSEPVAEAPPPPVPAQLPIDTISAPQTANQDKVRIIPTSPLTWSRSTIKKVKFSDGIAAWMAYDLGFKNWVKSVVMLAAENSLKTCTCTIPDCYRDDVGDSITIEMAGDGVMHVME